MGMNGLPSRHELNDATFFLKFLATCRLHSWRRFLVSLSHQVQQLFLLADILHDLVKRVCNCGRIFLSFLKCGLVLPVLAAFSHRSSLLLIQDAVVISCPKVLLLGKWSQYCADEDFMYLNRFNYLVDHMSEAVLAEFSSRPKCSSPLVSSSLLFIFLTT